MYENSKLDYHDTSYKTLNIGGKNHRRKVTIFRINYQNEYGVKVARKYVDLK